LLKHIVGCVDNSPVVYNAEAKQEASVRKCGIKMVFYKYHKTILCLKKTLAIIKTRSSAVVDKPRDASCR